MIQGFVVLTLLHSKRPKLYTILAFLGAIDYRVKDVKMTAKILIILAF